MAEDTLGQTERVTRGLGKYGRREIAAARANTVLLCVNESDIVEVRTLPPQLCPG